AQLVVLPEGTLPSYVLGDDRLDGASVDAAIERLAGVARDSGAVVIAGAALHAAGSPPLRNAAVAIDRDGTVAGRADKLFLWHFDRRWFAPGDVLAPVETSLGKLGVLVCADGRIPTIARALVDCGAELLAMPTAWVTSGRDPAALENVQADLLARVRAYENAVPFVAANKCGAELGMVAYCGKSQIVDARGRVAAIAGQHRPETIVADVEIGRARPHRTSPALLERRAAATSPVRLAISAEPPPRDAARRLEILGAAHLIAPGIGAEGFAALDATLPAAIVGDGDVLDPGGLVSYRRCGYALLVWETRGGEWTPAIARARALELRLYVVVLDSDAGRAYAVDPDGTTIAGTFGDYRIASFSLDPRKSADTTVAPGSDVAEAYERIASLVERSPEVTA
ncbi:MAG TPA: carbon-nitrogen hydrolase family protein, partial [Candidatus Tumulicola sp.]|nr:carbon-nitrogen hydrolase family protein [Candidatus Tumulicola sp.]